MPEFRPVIGLSCKCMLCGLDLKIELPEASDTGYLRGEIHYFIRVMPCEFCNKHHSQKEVDG